MTREAQLQFCKICLNHKKDLNLGIICGLRGGLADFEDQCSDFQEDHKLKRKTDGSIFSMGIDAHVASKGQRFTNYIIDFVCLVIFILVFSFVLGVIMVMVAPASLSVFDGGNTLLEYVFGAVVGTIYYATLEGISGQSIGKAITKTKVVTESGEKPDLATILLRSICRYIPFEAFSFLGSDAIGWHDSISKTRVVPIDFNPEKL